MKGAAFVAFAAGILRDSDEAACRSAVSRAYYGVLHEGMQLLDEIGIKIDTRHDNTAIDFKVSVLPEAIEIGRLLDELRNRRVSADYDLSDANVLQLPSARFVVARAQHGLLVLQALRTALQDAEIRSQMLTAIREARIKTGRRV